jgi:hypothetical protein
LGYSAQICKTFGSQYVHHSRSMARAPRSRVEMEYAEEASGQLGAGLSPPVREPGRPVRAYAREILAAAKRMTFVNEINVIWPRSAKTRPCRTSGREFGCVSSEVVGRNRSQEQVGDSETVAARLEHLLDDWGNSPKMASVHAPVMGSRW